MCHFWWTPKSGVFSRDIVQIYNKKMHQNVVKNFKRRVLELLSANGPLKKSLPITRQVRFEGLQNLEIWLLFQGLAATHNAICEWWVEFLIAVQFVKNLRQKFQPLKWSIYCRILRLWDALFFYKISLNFWFLSSMSARSRRALANLEEKIQKFIDTAFFWPVEVGEIFDATSYCNS